ncbi:MAG TPA: SigB/SigF/SigG family RNA polymerase sigma factor [Candidatus Dormibacteraeota bacterium]|nr:SigB/SigF/SigG family RNA polymerase sigma factor [Candidatus Dormibacteraeota bacterium]
MAAIATGCKPRKLVRWGERESYLLERARGGDRQAWDQLYRSLTPLAQALARKYRRRREPLEDLLQVSNLGLFNALVRFDPDRGVDFASFAVPTIAGEIKRYYRDHSWAVHVPRGIQERALKVERELARMSSELGRSPTPAELAERCEISVEDVLEARVAANGYSCVSLDVPPDDELVDVLPQPSHEEPGFGHVENADVIWPAVKVLPPREQHILALRFVEDLTQQEIASRVGISQMHVSRLMQRALKRVAVIVAAQLS